MSPSNLGETNSGETVFFQLQNFNVYSVSKDLKVFWRTMETFKIDYNSPTISPSLPLSPLSFLPFLLKEFSIITFFFF